MHTFACNRVTNEELKTLSFCRQKSRRTPHHPRAGKRRKMRDVGIVRCTCIRAWDSYVLRVPQGTKESHIHGIYGGIALLEHLRTTMTIHRDALLRARRAIRVMHQNAPSGFLSFFLFLSQFLRIVTQRRPVLCIRDSSHCSKQSILLQILIEKDCTLRKIFILSLEK